MSISSPSNQADPLQVANEEGRRVGLATGALALSIVAFLNLLGIEKSVLAAVLAILAMQGAGSLPSVLRRGRIALVIASIHALTVVVALILLKDKF